MNSIEVTKMEVFLVSSNEWSLKRKTSEMLELSLFKILSSVVKSWLKNFSLLLEKLE